MTPGLRPPPDRPSARRRSPTRRLARALPALVGVLGLAACGVSTTGVIEAGEAATAPSTTVNVYWVRDGKVAAVPVQTPGTATVSAAVALLLAGPTADETAKGYGSDLPPLSALPKIMIKDAVEVTVVLPGAPDPLPPTALRQVVCTAADVLRRSYPGDPAFATRRIPGAPDAARPATPVTVSSVLVTVVTSGRTTAEPSRGCP